MAYYQGNNPFKKVGDDKVVHIGESTGPVYEKDGNQYIKFFEGPNKNQEFKIAPNQQIITGTDPRHGGSTDKHLAGGDYKVTSKGLKLI